MSWPRMLPPTPSVRTQPASILITSGQTRFQRAPAHQPSHGQILAQTHPRAKVIFPIPIPPNYVTPAEAGVQDFLSSPAFFPHPTPVTRLRGRRLQPRNKHAPPPPLSWSANLDPPIPNVRISIKQDYYGLSMWLRGPDATYIELRYDGRREASARRDVGRWPYVQRSPVPKTMTTQARREFALGLEKFIGSLLMWIKDRFFRIS